MKRTGYLIAYFGSVYFIIVFLTLYSLSLTYRAGNVYKKELQIRNVNAQYQALPEENSQTFMSVTSKDGRLAALQEYLGSYNSALLPYAKKIIEEADKNELDYRLLPAIAMKESTLCKRIPKNSYNCWGFGIYGTKVTRFSDYNEAIETVSKSLAKNYIKQGYVEPYEIEKKYTPSSNGSWAQNVSLFMGRIHELL